MAGQVDQSAGMLDDEAKDKGYTLLCVSEPQSDCKVQVIEEVRANVPAFHLSCLPAVQAHLLYAAGIVQA